MNNLGLQLRNKTFLDFTTDQTIIGEIVGDKDFFLSHITEENRARTFICFSELTPDKELAATIRKEFKTEIDNLFPE